MGRLIDGKWVTDRLVGTGESGAFRRSPSVFRNWITPDGSPGPSGECGFEAESGRYHLYVAYACPWAHRTLIFRKLNGLDPHIGVSVVHPDMLDDGWTFSTDFPGATGDRLYGARFLREIYLRSDPRATTRVTVPVLWDRRRERIVSNESSEIIRMFNSAFDHITGNTEDFWPAPLRAEIEQVNARIYDTLNNGVYKCGFARSQEAYDRAIAPLFETLDWLDERLSGRRFLLGDRLTEADWRLFPTLVRFDKVYNVHFKCARMRVVDYPNLWDYTRALYQWPGVAETVRFDHIVRHYYFSHESINPYRIVPLVAEPDFTAPVSPLRRP